MAILPDCLRRSIRPFARAPTRPTSRRSTALMAGAVRTTGRRTVAHLRRTARGLAPGHPPSYHRAFARRRRAPRAVALALAGLILRRFAPDEPVPLAGGDSGDEHRGAAAYGQGRHRDPVRSTTTDTAGRRGHKRVVRGVWVRSPVAARPWAPPVLVALYRPPRGIASTAGAPRPPRGGGGHGSPCSGAGPPAAALSWPGAAAAAALRWPPSRTGTGAA